MGKIIAIGGGEIGQGETEIIDKYIVDLAKKQSPKLLFIPTASNDASGYVDTIEKKYGDLACHVDTLYLVDERYTDQSIREMILSADIIYVGGGDTVSMMAQWKKNKVDQYLVEAYEKGIVLSGLSAGAICWFKYGYSQANSLYNQGFWDSTRPHGLGLIDGVLCPHYNQNSSEKFDEMIQNEGLTGIALEDNTAFVECDGQYYIIKADENQKAYLLKSSPKGLVKEALFESKTVRKERL